MSLYFLELLCVLVCHFGNFIMNNIIRIILSNRSMVKKELVPKRIFHAILCSSDSLLQFRLLIMTK